MKHTLRALSKMDDNEKYFLMIAFAFVLIALFFIITGTFAEDVSQESVKIYHGFHVAEAENFTLNDLQKTACNNAGRYGACDKLAETYIATKEMCCLRTKTCCN